MSIKRKKLNGKALRTLVADDPVKLDQAREVWVMLVDGKDPFDIAIALNLPLHRVKKIIEVCMEEFTCDIQSAVALERSKDISRANAVIETFLPIAREPNVKDWKRPVQAAELVIRAIETRSKLFGYEKHEGPSVINNHAFFLTGETMKAIENFVQTPPLEIVDAEVLDMSFEP